MTDGISFYIVVLEWCGATTGAKYLKSDHKVM